MTLTRGFIRNAATTPLDVRLMDMAQVVGNADGSPRPGVLDADGRAIVTALGTMNVAVAAADFVTTKGTADGAAIFTNDGVVNVPIASSPASNSRITVIWVRHRDDTTGDPAGQATPIFGTTDGAAAATPAKPAIPTGALELATLRVYSGTTAANGGANTLTNTYQMTASRGGVVPFRTLVDLNQWSNPVAGQMASVLATTDAGLYRWDATLTTPKWVAMERTATFSFAIGAGGFTDSTLAGSAIPTTAVAEQTTDSDFVTARTGTSCTVTKGLYLVSLYFEINGGTFTGRSFSEIASGPNSSSTAVVMRNTAPQGVGENGVGCTTAVYAPTDGTVIVGRIFKVSGGNVAVSGRLVLVKVT